MNETISYIYTGFLCQFLNVFYYGPKDTWQPLSILQLIALRAFSHVVKPWLFFVESTKDGSTQLSWWLLTFQICTQKNFGKLF